jgi:hypothetical protein
MRLLCLTLAGVLLLGCSQTVPTAPSSLGLAGESNQVGSTHDAGAAAATLKPDGVLWDNADHGGRSYFAALTGSAEVPGPGDPDGSGTLDITANVGQAELCYALRTQNIDVITGVHLHLGAASVSGDHVFTIDLPVNGYSHTCVDQLDRDLIKSIRDTPEGYYVNVHTQIYPAGAIRGQLAAR